MSLIIYFSEKVNTQLHVNITIYNITLICILSRIEFAFFQAVGYNRKRT